MAFEHLLSQLCIPLQLRLHSRDLLDCGASSRQLQEDTFPARHPTRLSPVQTLGMPLRTFQAHSRCCHRSSAFKPYPLMPSLGFSGFCSRQLLPSAVYISCILLTEDAGSLLIRESNGILSPAHLGATFESLRLGPQGPSQAAFTHS